MSNITYNRAGIMQRAWYWYRAAEARGETGNSLTYAGKPVTLAECMRRAWAGAKQEAAYFRKGATVVDGTLILPRGPQTRRVEFLQLAA